MRHAGRLFAYPAAVLAATIAVCAPALADEGAPRSTIAFTSNRDDPDPAPANWEIWLMDGDGSNPRRLTFNTDPEGYGDFMPILSPDGKGKIVFDSNRTRVVRGEPPNTTPLFLIH